jgi:hypothetical protein
MLSGRKIVSSLTLVIISLFAAAVCQGQDGFAVRGQSKTASPENRNAQSTPAEDISGMYSFLKEGEFVQINLEKTGGVSGYISRMGETESDRGVFLDQFFDKAQIQGHDVSFTTRPLHNLWYEFKGKFERGPGKSKADDAYYILRGTLKEYTLDENKKPLARSREVELKSLGQPDDSDPGAPAKSKKPKD